MQQRRCLVSAAVLAPEYGKTLTIGQVVDLDERLPGGGTLADVTDASWFEMLPTDPTPAGSRRRAATLSDAPTMPARPAAEE